MGGAHALQPDLILLDMQLPDMNGVDVLRTLRGADDCWTKPLDFEGFLAGLTEVLSCRRVAA